jgi:4-amino-4-deoxy-L-arabinose transferase-like glycosyltransferase
MRRIICKHSNATISTMKIFKKSFSDKRIFLFALTTVFFLRLAYAATRDIFSSGPDAPFYAVAPLELAKYGLWSDQIQYLPYYPVGYPLSLWPIVELAGTHWILVAQIFQISISIGTVWLVYKASMIFMRREIALGIGVLFLIIPAFSVMSGQAMYEPILMFTFYAYLYLILKEVNTSNNFSRLILSGFVAGAAAVIHPRTIPWIFVIQLILIKKLNVKKTLIFFVAFLIPVIFFVVRNALIYNRWTLMSAVVLDPYESSKSSADVLKNGFFNILYFWSPLSGDAKRSTWYHNVTFYHLIREYSHSTSVVTFIAIVFGVLSFTFWLSGALLLMKIEPIIGKIILSIPILAMATDFFAAGDSRHRLVIIPLLLVGQVWSCIYVYQKIPWSRKIKM